MSEQDDHTIRLEGRYLGLGDTPSLTLKCGLVTYREAAFKETKGADGSVMRSAIEQPSLMVSGLPTSFDVSKGSGRTSFLGCFRTVRANCGHYAFEWQQGALRHQVRELTVIRPCVGPLGGLRVVERARSALSI